MKKVILTMALLTGFAGLAQKGEYHREHEVGTKDMTPEQVATLQTKKLNLILDLTEDQQLEIQKTNLENVQRRRAKIEEYKATKEASESKKHTSEERFNIQNERLDRKIAEKEKMKQLLSKEQFKKWEMLNVKKSRSKRSKKGKGKCHIKG